MTVITIGKQIQRLVSDSVSGAQVHRGFVSVATAQVVALLLGTVFWLLLATLLHPLAFGNLSWLVSIATVLSTICTLGLGKTAITHLPLEKDGKLLSGFVAIVFILSLIVGAMAAVILEPAIGLLVVGLSLFSIAIHIELADWEYKNYLWMWLGARSLCVFLPILIYFIWGLVTGILVGLGLAYLLLGCKVLRHLRSKPDFRNILKSLKFTLSVWGTDLSRVAIHFLDKILIGALFGMAVLGYYHFAYRIFLLFGILPQILFFYLLPEKSAGRDTGKIERAGILASFGFAGAMYLFVSLVVPSVFPGFTEGVQAAQVMGLAIVPATIVGIKTADLYAKRKVNVVFWSHLLALGVGILGIISLGRVFGLLGLALSFLALQCALCAALVLLPKLRGETGRIIAGSIGVLLLVGLVMSSTGVQGLQIEIDGNVVRGKGLAMDTTVSITVVDENTQRAKAAMRAAFDEVLRIEKLMSHTDESSEIYALNHARTDWVSLSPELIYVLRKSLYHAELSGGHFDPTVKPLVDLWMEKVKAWGRLPITDELSEALAVVGWENLMVDENNRRARFLKEGMEITLGGIAKGYAVDRASEVLVEHGVRQALVGIGGDIRVFGPRVWRIAIQHPRREFEHLCVIELKNAAVSTSGDYRRFFLLGERRVHHILNPKTGQPADASMSVTIIAENSIDADALSTGVFVLGPEKGKELLNSLGIKGLIVASDGRIITSDAWDFPLDDSSH